MRILHLTRDFPPRHSGGLSTAVAGLVRAQHEAGMACVVLSFDNFRPASRVSRTAQATRVIAPCGSTLIRVEHETNLASALQLAKEMNCTLVHIHHEGLWAFAVELADALKAKTVYSVHVWQREQDRLRESPGSRSTAEQERALYGASALHLPSQAVADLLRLGHPELCRKAHTISLASVAAMHDDAPGCEAVARSPLLDRVCAKLDGLDAPGCETVARSPLLDRVCTKLDGLDAPGCETAARSPLLAYAKARSCEQDERVQLVAYVGRFADINGFAQFLQALPGLFAKNPELGAIAAGGLPGNERGETRWRKRWRAMAGAHTARLTMPGWLGEEQLAALYKRAAVLVVPSWFETFGQVVLEGMRHGTPLVTTGAGAIAELVDEKSALLIEAKSSNAIATAVQEVLDDPLSARDRASRAFCNAHEDYLWSDRMPAFLALYQRLHD